MSYTILSFMMGYESYIIELQLKFLVITKVTMSSVFAENKLLINTFPIGIAILVGIVSTVIIFLLTSLNLRKLVKKMPADLMVE